MKVERGCSPASFVNLAIVSSESLIVTDWLAPVFIGVANRILAFIIVHSKENGVLYLYLNFGKRCPTANTDKVAH